MKISKSPKYKKITPNRTTNREVLRKNVGRARGPKSFPGRIINSKKFISETPGRFVKETKGQKGKFFIEKGLRFAVDSYIYTD